ncbi:MAG: ABC transporter permease [Gammaproteobacteria bacterium]|nr:ABC transporter permease [Gammaproteobacteria bacterium]
MSCKKFLLKLAWHDLRASGRSLWVFCACIVLGVTLVAASGGLYRLVSTGLLADTRQLMGGDLDVDSKQPLPAEALDWMAEHGTVSLMTELYTMLGTAEGDFVRVELQSVDERYPLYGKLQLSPAGKLADLTAFNGQFWGVAIDQSLAQRYGLDVGQRVFIGILEMEIRSLIIQQPDRALTADWRGPPVLIPMQAIREADLIQPGSRVDYDYRVATDIPAARWKNMFYERFPDETWEVRTFEDRSQRIAERLGQIASGLLIIGFSTLFIGGLGVFSSIQSYLQGKLKTIATLRSLGLRNRRLAAVYLLQVGILGGGSSLVGCLIGALLGLLGATVVAAELALVTTLDAVLAPLFAAFAFGLLTAFCFALPAIGRALAVSPASLFRDADQHAGHTPPAWRLATAINGGLIVLLVLLTLPDPLFGVGFILVVGLVLVLLEIILRLIRRGAIALEQNQRLEGRFALRLALANLHRPGTPLRSALLSLGSALTLLVACTLVVVSLMRTLQATIPDESPGMVLYDINADQVAEVTEAVRRAAAGARVETAPLVRARIDAINDQPVSELLANGDHELRDALNDDYKLSYRAGNIDGISLVEGAWWAENTTLPTQSLEDREARELGIAIGDRIRYRIDGRTFEVEVGAIHQQKGVQTRFWFEGIVSDGLLDPFINRQVGAAWLDDALAIEAQRQIAAVAPNVITVRTARILATAGDLLGQATLGLVVVAAISLAASLLVLISVIAAGRSRQVYAATVLNTLGARLSVIRQSLQLEYLLLALVTAIFAVLLGTAIALPLLEIRMKLPSTDLVWVGALTAIVISIASLSLGTHYLLRRLRVRPAILLRDAG